MLFPTWLKVLQLMPPNPNEDKDKMRVLEALSAGVSTRFGLRTSFGDHNSMLASYAMRWSSVDARHFYGSQTKILMFDALFNGS